MLEYEEKQGIEKKDFYDYDDPYTGIMTECCKTFIHDYFKYLSKGDIVMANSILYQFNHCPWLDEITDTPHLIIQAMIEEGERRYGKNKD